MKLDIHGLKIVHFAKYYPPEWGGIENVTHVLAQGAARHGAQVSVICFSRRKTPSETRGGVRIIRCKERLKPASQPLGLKYIFKCLQEGRRADIVHIHAPNMLAALLSILLPRRVKTLVHWHSDIVGKGLIAKLTRPLEKLMLKRAAHIVCTSDRYAQASPAVAGMEAKTSTVPLGINDPAKAKPQTTPKLPASVKRFVAGRRIILSVGRLVPYKGYSVLIEAASQIDPGAVCLVIGSGPLKEKLEQQIDTLGIADKIRFIGTVNSAELDTLFRSASLFCLPSVERSEAFGVVLLEAMAHGLPIVATSIEGSGVPWVNAHGKSGINVMPRDPQALATACNRILSDTALHKYYGRGARHRFEEKFTEDISLSKFLRLYTDIANL